MGEARPLLSSATGRRIVPDAGARLGGGSSFHFLSNVIAGARRAARRRAPGRGRGAGGAPRSPLRAAAARD
jgi:hypothetical protein